MALTALRGLCDNVALNLKIQQIKNGNFFGTFSKNISYFKELIESYILTFNYIFYKERIQEMITKHEEIDSILKTNNSYVLFIISLFNDLNKEKLKAAKVTLDNLQISFRLYISKKIEQGEEQEKINKNNYFEKIYHSYIKKTENSQNQLSNQMFQNPNTDFAGMNLQSSMTISCSIIDIMNFESSSKIYNDYKENILKVLKIYMDHISLFSTNLHISKEQIRSEQEISIYPLAYICNVLFSYFTIIIEHLNIKDDQLLVKVQKNVSIQLTKFYFRSKEYLSNLFILNLNGDFENVVNFNETAVYSLNMFIVAFKSYIAFLASNYYSADNTFFEDQNTLQNLLVELKSKFYSYTLTLSYFVHIVDDNMEVQTEKYERYLKKKQMWQSS
ncbi:hypothetical protein EDEG_00182 [Edhazardia aedis USNM 41457]|uniref:Uncharacterized protein n=1 Tax=Edhazardia aedis (strain USNM 41457) TaxID=1003232 RepID=J9D863_EDHAE|nr:hypothetical protein EDEG_00182 [Edhazardia aedis USNM 41457]|eukprot:EJW03694.1 hypothetical protein EDEG_00182 [Edhazardia aedis USNM 41457]